MIESDANFCRAHNAIDRTWRPISDRFLIRLTEGRPADRLPDLSEQQAARVASEAQTALRDIETIDLDSLPHETALTVKIVQFHLNIEAQSSWRYDLAHNYGVFPAMFPITPYGGGYFLSAISRELNRFVIRQPADADHYLALLEDYARLLRQMRSKLIEQAARGIRIPRPALPGVRALVAAQSTGAQGNLNACLKRLESSSVPSGFADVAERRLQSSLIPAFAALLDTLDDDYARRSPEGVGIGQFSEGASLYEALIAEHLSAPATIEAIHRIGQEHVAGLDAEMTVIRESLGFADRDSFHRYLLTDPEWSAQTKERVEAWFSQTLRRIEPHIKEFFRFVPAAPYRTVPLDPKLEGSMTAGYYDPPTAATPEGIYYFNGANAAKSTLAELASLIYHELIPGHHFHIASQRENKLLHPLRQTLLFNAFNEGWAEYAATLAGEIGMYAHPCERYGRLLKETFLASRLVVDTGLNVLGWSLDRARQYLREHTLLSDVEIQSETLRYSTDIPAQSLAYQYGKLKFLELRRHARTTLGDRFDIRDFHDVVLGSGGMPLEILEWHVNSWLRS